MSLMAPPLANERPPAAESAFMQAVLGPSGTARQGIKRLLWLLPSYGFALTVLLIAVSLKRTEAWHGQILTAYSLSGLGLFYVLLRGGFTAKLRDPALTFAQVLFSLGAVGLSYALIEPARALALEWLCLILVFSMRHLSTWQSRGAALGAVGLLFVTSLVRWRIDPAGIQLQNELANLASVVLTVPALLTVTRVGRRMHQRRLDQRAALADTLEQLNALSIRDGLTQLFNRRHMLSLLEEEVRRQHRTHRVFCVAILDLDFFKRINDEHGHATGDAVLRDFAMLARGAFSGSDAAARWGGEEFLVLVSEAGLGHALQALERLRQAVHQHDWTVHAPLLTVTFSAGVCQHDAADTLAQTLEHADAALYQAKAQGRDRALASSAIA